MEKEKKWKRNEYNIYNGEIIFEREYLNGKKDGIKQIHQF